MTYRIKTPNHNTTVSAHGYHTGSDGLDYYFENERGEKVGSIPLANCEGVFREGVLES